MKKRIGFTAGALAVLAGLVSGCIIAPREGYREGYYDRDHHRYYHGRAWHECVERDDHCR